MHSPTSHIPHPMWFQKGSSNWCWAKSFEAAGGETYDEGGVTSTNFNKFTTNSIVSIDRCRWRSIMIIHGSLQLKTKYIGADETWLSAGAAERHKYSGPNNLKGLWYSRTVAGWLDYASAYIYCYICKWDDKATTIIKQHNSQLLWHALIRFEMVSK